MDNDDNYDWFSGIEKTKVFAGVQCPGHTSHRNGVFLRASGKILGSLASSSFGQCKKGDTQNGTEEIVFNEVVEKTVEILLKNSGV